MTTIKEALLLYAVTDRGWLKTDQKLSERVEQALAGGATMVQLREKGMDKESVIQQAKELLEVTKRYGVPLIINDQPEIALASGAQGVHVGPEDMSVQQAREMLGPKAVVGASARSVEQAVAAQAQGANYLGAGAVFGTSTKSNAATMRIETLKEICEAVSIPVVAIGGIGRDNILKLKSSGVSGAAVVSSLFAQEDIRNAAAELSALARQVIERNVGILRVNGKETKLAENINLEDFLVGLGYNIDCIAVERNQEIVPKSRFSQTIVKDSDTIEVVHFVGGGC